MADKQIHGGTRTPLFPSKQKAPPAPMHEGQSLTFESRCRCRLPADLRVESGFRPHASRLLRQKDRQEVFPEQATLDARLDHLANHVNLQIPGPALAQAFLAIAQPPAQRAVFVDLLVGVAAAAVRAEAGQAEPAPGLERIGDEFNKALATMCASLTRSRAQSTAFCEESTPSTENPRSFPCPAGKASSAASSASLRRAGVNPDSLPCAPHRPARPAP